MVVLTIRLLLRPLNLLIRCSFASKIEGKLTDRACNHIQKSFFGNRTNHSSEGISSWTQIAQMFCWKLAVLPTPKLVMIRRRSFSLSGHRTIIDSVGFNRSLCNWILIVLEALRKNLEKKNSSPRTVAGKWNGKNGVFFPNLFLRTSFQTFLHV